MRRGLCFLLLCAGCGRVDIDMPRPMRDASVEDVTAVDTSPCAAGMAFCNGKCIDVTLDPKNCGGCGVACGDMALCQKGQCNPCPPGFLVCGGKCVDVAGDAKNCGKCGNACVDPEVCASGICSTSCPIGRSKCGTSCVDVLADPAHCGGCNISCNGGNCLSGICCKVGEVLCGGKCVDTQTDVAHCGMCDKKCTGTCSMGQCCNKPPTGMCSHSPCDQGQELQNMCDGVGCVQKVCAQDPYCCSVNGAWDGICVSEVDQYCGPQYSCKCK